MRVRPYRATDRREWLRLRRAFWPDLLDENGSEGLDAEESLGFFEVERLIKYRKAL